MPPFCLALAETKSSSFRLPVSDAFFFLWLFVVSYMYVQLKSKSWLREELRDNLLEGRV